MMASLGSGQKEKEGKGWTEGGKGAWSKRAAEYRTGDDMLSLGGA